MISHAGRMCLGEVLATKSHAGGIAYRKAFKDKSCRKDVLSGGACKDISSSGSMCLAEMLSRKIHAG